MIGLSRQARWRLLLPMVVVAAVAAGMVAAVVLGAGTGGASVHSAVQAYQPEADGLTPVVIQATGDTDALVAAVERAGGTVTREFHLIPAVEAAVPQAAMEQLAADPRCGW